MTNKAIEVAMNRAKQRKLEKAGFKVGTVQEFLELSDEEMAVIDLKIRLIEKLKAMRKSKSISQEELAKRIESSQSRIAKMESGSPDVSLDLICKALFALGVSHRDLGKAVGSSRAA
jgi:DNA-binding XRE family transcriptional regulator